MGTGLSVDYAAQHCPHRSRWYCNVCSDQTDLRFVSFVETHSAIFWGKFRISGQHKVLNIQRKHDSITRRHHSSRGLWCRVKARLVAHEPNVKRSQSRSGANGVRKTWILVKPWSHLHTGGKGLLHWPHQRWLWTDRPQRPGKFYPICVF